MSTTTPTVSRTATQTALNVDRCLQPKHSSAINFNLKQSLVADFLSAQLDANQSARLIASRRQPDTHRGTERKTRVSEGMT